MTSQPGKSAIDVKKPEKLTPSAKAPATAELLWDIPFRTLKSEMDRVFDRFIASSGVDEVGTPWDPFRAMSSWVGATPSVDLKETGKAIEISAELPGLDEKDVEITLSQGLLTLKGEKRTSREEKKDNYHLNERRYGSFRRSFRIPDGIDPDKVSAEFEKGVLTVVLPKTKEAQKESRKIGIKSK